MRQIKRVLRIPKDPRRSETVFLTEMPYDLLEKMDSEEWKAHIDGLNQIMLAKERPSIWNFIRIILIIPALLKQDTYDREVRKYLKKVNGLLHSKGIYIEDPSSSGYTELEIVISE